MKKDKEFFIYQKNQTNYSYLTLPICLVLPGSSPLKCAK